MPVENETPNTETPTENEQPTVEMPAAEQAGAEQPTAEALTAEQPAPRKKRGPIIAGAAAAVVLILVVVALNVIGIVKLPFLPQSPELVLLRSLDGVTHDGTFNLDVSTDTVADLKVSLNGLEESGDVDLALTATGTARDFDANDLSRLRVEDGTFVATTSLALDSGLLKGETGAISAEGTYDLVIAEGKLYYVLLKPLKHSGVFTFDSSKLTGNSQSQGEGDQGAKDAKAVKNAVAGAGQSQGDGGLGLEDIKDMKMEGDVITFTVSTESLSTKDAEQLLEGILQPTGLDVTDTETTVSDLNVRVDVSNKDVLRANVTATVAITAQGESSIGLGERFSFPLKANLDLIIPVNVDIVLS